MDSILRLGGPRRADRDVPATSGPDRSLSLPGHPDPDPLDERCTGFANTRDLNLWRAGCDESRTSGSEGGPGRRAGREAATAPRPDPYMYVSDLGQLLLQGLRHRRLVPPDRRLAGSRRSTDLARLVHHSDSECPVPGHPLHRAPGQRGCGHLGRLAQHVAARLEGARGCEGWARAWWNLGQTYVGSRSIVDGTKSSSGGKRRSIIPCSFDQRIIASSAARFGPSS